MKKFLFVDLDDTLFQTPKKCLSETELQPAAYLKDGKPCSYTTPRQRAFFDFAQNGMTLIPATARNADAFRRVDLPFSSYTVLDYGGIVLQPGGALDSIWLAQMQGDMQVALPGLIDAMRVIDDFQNKLGRPARARLIEDFATPFYIVIKDHEAVAERLAEIEREVLLPWIAGPGPGSDFFIHRNGNNLAVLPKTLNKARAVAHLRATLEAEHGPILTFGMGDSASDARFMAACDYAIVPNGTQLAGLTLAAL